METLPPNDFVPTWEVAEVEDEAPPVEEAQRGLLAKAMAAFGFKQR
jgi:hypothetical protein